MREKHFVIKSFLLALWMMSSFMVVGAIYAAIGSCFSSGVWWDLQSSFGVSTIHLLNNSSVAIPWFAVVVGTPFFIVWAMPVVWFLTQNENKDRTQTSEGIRRPADGSPKPSM